jgi:hypothetical protein
MWNEEDEGRRRFVVGGVVAFVCVILVVGDAFTVGGIMHDVVLGVEEHLCVIMDDVEGVVLVGWLVGGRRGGCLDGDIDRGFLRLISYAIFSSVLCSTVPVYDVLVNVDSDNGLIILYCTENGKRSNSTGSSRNPVGRTRGEPTPDDDRKSRDPASRLLKNAAGGNKDRIARSTSENGGSVHNNAMH